MRVQRSVRLIVGAVLVVAGLLSWLGHHLVASGEAHSYTDGKPPPRYVTMHDGSTYVLGYPGGRGAAQRAGAALDMLRCTATGPDGASQQLRLTVEGDQTKATDQIASFRAPFGGAVHVSCGGLSPVYVDDATGDPSGLLLILAVLALAIGLPVLLSGIRVAAASQVRRSPAAGGPRGRAAPVTDQSVPGG